MGPPPFSDGNTFREYLEATRILPSMGPPPFSDGNPQSRRMGRPSISLQWGHRLSAMETRSRLGRPPVFLTFNGATAFQRWKLSGSIPAVMMLVSLQWGHRLSAMETPVTPQGQVEPVDLLQWGHRLSAMETITTPTSWNGTTTLQWGHRLSAMETAEHGQFPKLADPQAFATFNGATAFQRWKPGRLMQQTDGRAPSLPSMGPPPFSDGNVVETRWSLAGFSETPCQALQWGHRLSAMETRIADARPFAEMVPSMGPPPFSDGNSEVWVWIQSLAM